MIANTYFSVFRLRLRLALYIIWENRGNIWCSRKIFLQLSTLQYHWFTIWLRSKYHKNKYHQIEKEIKYTTKIQSFNTSVNAQFSDFAENESQGASSVKNQWKICSFRKSGRQSAGKWEKLGKAEISEAGKLY